MGTKAAMLSLGFSQLSIPSMPRLAKEALSYAVSPSPDIALLAKFVGSDAGLASHILRLANSPYYSLKPTSDPKAAILRIGLVAAKQVILTHSLCHGISFPKNSGMEGFAFWRHGTFVGQLAGELARKVFPETSMEASQAADVQLAGLLHDVGLYVLALGEPTLARALVAESRHSGCRLHEAEQALGLPPHGTLGARVAREWNLPPRVARLIEVHEVGSAAKAPPDVADRPSSEQEAEEWRMAQLLALADALAERFGVGFLNHERWAPSGLPAGDASEEEEKDPSTREPSSLFDREIDTNLLKSLSLDAAFVTNSVGIAKHFIETFFSPLVGEN